MWRISASIGLDGVVFGDTWVYYIILFLDEFLWFLFVRSVRSMVVGFYEPVFSYIYALTVSF